MKPIPLILAFLPLVAFSLLAKVLPSGDIGAAALVAALLAATAMVTIRPLWPPKILNATSLVLFAVLAAVGFTGSTGTDRWEATWAGAGVGLVMGAVILLLIPVMPFTEQFARETTPQAYWSSPTFKQINRVLSVGWGLAIVGLGVFRVLAAIIDEHTTSHALPQILLGTVIPLGIIIYMLKFSRQYPDRIAHNDASPAHP
jgi:hypothetical protein